MPKQTHKMHSLSSHNSTDPISFLSGTTADNILSQAYYQHNGFKAMY